jgi:hypothetical protein
MLAILTTLASVLPGFALNALASYLNATTTKAVEAEQTTRQVALAAVNGIVAARRAQAAGIQTGMAHKAFWIPWSIAALAAVAWYAWGMADSAWPGHLPHVATLPPQLLAFTQQIWDNLFLSGGIALGGTSIASAIKAALAKK